MNHSPLLTCEQAQLLIRYGAEPGTPRRGLPELGFHLASCSFCRTQWEHDRRAARPVAVHCFPGVRRIAGPTPRQDPAEQCRAERASDRDPQDPDANRAGSAPNPINHRHVGMLDERKQEAAQAVTAPAARVPDGTQGGDDQEKEKRVSYAALLRNPNFRLLWLGQAISTLGSYFTRVVIPVYVYDLTQSYAHLGFSAFSSLIASLLFGLVAGALVDRWDRRRMMIAVDLANAGLLAVLFVMTLAPLTVTYKLVGLYAINFLTALLRELFTPARIAIFTEVVAERELLTANSLDQATSGFSELLSYPLASIVLLSLGPGIAFGIDALTFLASAVLLLGVRVQRAETQREERQPLIKEIAAGVHLINRLPLVRMVVLLSLVVPLMISWYNTLQLPFVVDALHSTKELGFPIMEGSVTLGFALGVLALGWWGQRIARSRLIVFGIVGLGLLIALQGLIPLVGAHLERQPVSIYGLSLLLFLVLPCTLCIGAMNSLVFAGVRTVLQEETPRAALGRVASVVSVASGLGFAIGALLTGLADGRVALVICLIGIAIAVVGIISQWFFNRYQSFASRAEQVVALRALGE